MKNAATLTSVTFSEFDEYAAAIEDADLRMRLPRLERSQWAMQHINLQDSIHVQLAREGSGSLPIGAIREDGFVLFLAIGEVRANGKRLDRDSVFLMPPRSEFCLPTKGENEWISIYIPIAAAEATGLMPPHEDVIGNSARVLHSPRGAADRLRSNIKRFAVNAQNQPSLLSQAASVTSFRQVLTDCVKDCLCIDAAKSERRTGRPPATS